MKAIFPISGGAQDPEEDLETPPGGDTPPEPPPATPDPVAEMRALREETAKTNAMLGKVLEENERLRADRDAARLRGDSYRPTVDERPAAPPREDPAVSLEKVISEGIPENERLAPTASTVAKMLVKAAPTIGEFVRSEIATHEYRRQLDDDFWQALSEDDNWQGRTPRDLKKRHGKRVALLSQELFLGRDGRTKPEYLNNPDKAFADLKGALERELNISAEDAPAPPSSRRSRPATGDQPVGRHVRTAPAPESIRELEKTVSETLAGPTARRR